jgi:acyl-CoA hydrolase
MLSWIVGRASEMLPKLITAADVPGLLRPGMVVYAPGLAGESAVFVAALRGAPEACAGVRFVGVWLPSINRVDYAGLHPDARASAFFIGRDFAASFAAGRIDFRPLSYFAIYAWLRDRVTVDFALLNTSAPDADGRLSLGVAIHAGDSRHCADQGGAHQPAHAPHDRRRARAAHGHRLRGGSGRPVARR